MGKSLFRVFYRKIKEHLSQFLALIAISAIGVAIFTGINSVESTMQTNANNYFRKQNISDIEVFNPTGIKQKDIDKLNIKDYDKYLSLDATLKYDGNENVIKLNSTSKYNQPVIENGRNIKNDKECLVDIDSYYLINKTVNIDTFGVNKKCKVVGSAYFPQYFNSMQKGYSSINSSEIKTIVYTTPKFIKNYTQYLPFDYNMLSIKDNNLNVFSDKYINQMKTKVKTIEKTLDDNKIFITSFDKNASVDSYANDSSQIKEIAAIFPVIFFLVSALVGSSVMSRMIDDERIQIGTLSALGYGRYSIISTYIIYAIIATLVGWFIGTLIGIIIIPQAVMQAYSSLYQLPELEIIFDKPVILSALSLAAITIVGTTIIVSFNQTRTTCATLMRPKTPIAGKKILLEKITFIWNRFSFLNKVSIRNLFRYKKRLVMSILAIMGCSGLLMTGLGVRSSVSPIIDLQYNKVYNYDIAAYSTPLKKEFINSELPSLKKIDGIKDVTPLYRQNSSLISSNKKEDLNIIVPMNNRELNKFIKFKNAFKEDSVYITQKIALSYKLKKGDKITLELDNNKYSFTITDIVEHYVDNFIYINNKTFKKEFGNFDYNNFLFQKNGDLKQITKKLEDKTYFNVITNNNKIMDTVSQSMNGLDNIVYIMVAFAGLLVIIVMYTLTNLNLSERQRELATLKVLGYYDNEISKYIFKENIILTIVGLVFGLIFGTYLHRYIITMAEMPNIYFLKVQPPINYILTIIFTIIFTLTVNIIMSRKIKQINMVESLKSIE